MKPLLFLGAAILAGAALFKMGAPLVPVLLGVAIAAVLTWKTQKTKGE